MELEAYLEDEDEEYWDETNPEVLWGSTLEVAADEVVSLYCLSCNSAVLNWDSNYWILDWAVLSLSSSSLTWDEEEPVLAVVDLSLSISWESWAFSALREAIVLSESTPEN